MHLFYHEATLKKYYTVNIGPLLSQPFANSHLHLLIALRCIKVEQMNKYT